MCSVAFNNGFVLKAKFKCDLIIILAIEFPSCGKGNQNWIFVCITCAKISGNGNSLSSRRLNSWYLADADGK